MFDRSVKQRLNQHGGDERGHEGRCRHVERCGAIFLSFLEIINKYISLKKPEW